MDKIEKLHQERGERYGDWIQQCVVIDLLNKGLYAGSSYNKCTPAQKAKLDMIVHKISRIVNGDPDWQDHWDDIAGYALLPNHKTKGT